MPIPLREESGFGFDLDVFEKSVSRKTKLIIINSPQNPTGGVLEVEQLGRIAEIARHYRIPVLTDEIYKSLPVRRRVRLHHALPRASRTSSSSSTASRRPTR